MLGAHVKIGLAVSDHRSVDGLEGLPFLGPPWGLLDRAVLEIVGQNASFWLAEKLDILQKLDEDPKRKRTELAKELGLAASTLSTIVAQRDSIMKNVLSFNVNAKQVKTAQHVKLEETLLTWFKEVTAVGVNIDGKVLREKADEFALALHIDGVQASGRHRDFPATVEHKELQQSRLNHCDCCNYVQAHS
ncbi:hypothetical protein HPB49_024845 [Dermacentor silvarum]|uniref:Uncharacterized protein n=1 Tax=Dermacentor silvarum TaxID=543639 RepID=A0ACB8C664_DERSI|nr:hypothetical protein HPB49_024845 [Dermacentor silvarum]